MEFRDTGLPLDKDVYTAFMQWRNNAKDFAALSGLPEDYPVRVAQHINATEPDAKRLMTLALMMTVPEPAWGIMEQRFPGQGVVAAMEEMWKHVRTGYAYLDDAGEDVKGLALAAAAVSFGDFSAKAEKTMQTLMTDVQMGKNPGEVMRGLLGPECRRYERLGENVGSTEHAALAAAYEEKRAGYLDARETQESQLEDMGIPMPDDDDGSSAAGYPDFEDTGLLDDPKVRAAYSVITHHTRVSNDNFADALVVGSLLSESRNPVTVAAGLVDAALRETVPDDYGFLAKKLDPKVMDIVQNYNVTRAFLDAPQELAGSPQPVRQIAIARGIVMMDSARQHSEKLLEMVAAHAHMMGPEKEAEMRHRSMEPADVISRVVPVVLAPLFGTSGMPKLESLFVKHMEALDAFVAGGAGAHEMETAEQARPAPRGKRPPGNPFRL